MIVLTINQSHDTTADIGLVRQLGQRHSECQTLLSHPIAHPKITGWDHFVPSGEVIPVYGTKKYLSSRMQRHYFGPTLGDVVRKETIGRHELAELLKALRTDSRMSREQLAEAGELSVGPIKRIETEGHVPKAPTLQLIANGLATYAPGRRDDELAAAYYDRLMRAAGYMTGPATAPLEPSRSVDNLTDEEVVDELERHFGSREVAVSMWAAGKNWRNLKPQSQRLILETVRYASGEDDEPTPSKRSGR